MKVDCFIEFRDNGLQSGPLAIGCFVILIPCEVVTSQIPAREMDTTQLLLRGCSIHPVRAATEGRPYRAYLLAPAGFMDY